MMRCRQAFRDDRRRARVRCGNGRRAAADIALGKAKAAEVCESCHGADGNSTSQDFPKLGGQYPDYLAKALRDYKSGDRKNADHGGVREAAVERRHREPRRVLRRATRGRVVQALTQQGSIARPSPYVCRARHAR